MTQQEIAAALEHNGYTPEMASGLAGRVLAFFEAAGIEARLTTHPSPGPKRQIEFFIGDPTCRIENADVVTFAIVHPPKTKWLGGTWLDTAPLTYLARVCEIGDRLLGPDWLGKVNTRLANRHELLDALNEIWWLGCLKGVKSITPSPKVAGGGDNDWHIVFEDGLSIILQVKRRHNDLVRIVHHSRPPYGLFDKVSKRFSAGGKLELNVGAITIYAGITPAVLRALDDYFRSDDSQGVDAIIFWNPASPPFLPAFFLRERSAVKKLASYLQQDPLDDLYQTHNIHPLSLDEAISNESTFLA